MTEDQDAARLAAESLGAADATGWFEELYAQAERGAAVVPWDREAPSALLADWAAGFAPSAAAGRRAIVVGCGFGRDAEFVASLGFDTLAFDIAPTAIDTARARHPGTRVDYTVADLFALPAGWRGVFDLVVESHNVQALPPELHAAAAAAVASLVATGGTLLVLAAAADGPPQAPPWPLAVEELELFAVDGLRRVSAERVDSAGPRWRAVFTR